MSSIARTARPLGAKILNPSSLASRRNPRPRWQMPRAGWACSRTARGFATTVAAQEKKYTKDHEWVELSSDGKIGTIGISTYAAKALGDVVYVELPTAEMDVSAGDSIGAVESVKSASDIMTPLSGKVVEANAVLEDKPGTINAGPEAEGWIAKIEVKDSGELADLMSGEEYVKFTEE